MNDDEKHLDVKPGHVPVSHTSRPIITSTDSPTRDPMVTGGESQNTSPKSTEHKELNLQPPTLKAESKTTEAAVPAETTSSELPKSVADTDTEKAAPEDIVPKLVAEKTYKLPISPTPAKRLVLALVIASIIIAVLAVVAMFVLSAG